MVVGARRVAAVTIVEKNDHLKNQLSLGLSIENGSLLDFETTGLLNHEEHEIVGFGYITSNNLVSLGRRTKNKEPFYSEIRRIVNKLPKPFYAYNAPFDKGILKAELGVDSGPYDFICLMEPWKIKAQELGAKWPSLDQLICLPEEYFGEPRVEGRDVPGLWKEYLHNGNDDTIRKIMRHNLSDLLREAVLLLLHLELYHTIDGEAEKV